MKNNLNDEPETNRDGTEITITPKAIRQMEYALVVNLLALFVENEEEAIEDTIDRVMEKISKSPTFGAATCIPYDLGKPITDFATKKFVTCIEKALAK